MHNIKKIEKINTFGFIKIKKHFYVKEHCKKVKKILSASYQIILVIKIIF